jgi:hypothetical protein
MFQHFPSLSLARRSFLSRLGIGLAGGAALTSGAIPAAHAQTGEGGGRWQPARHAADDWYDQIPGQHRFVFDTISADGLTLALTFINNYLNASESGYGLKDKDHAVVLVLRHRSTPFAFNNAIWGKHGVAITRRSQFNDPTTNQPPKVNVFAPPAGTPERGRQGLTGVIARGVHLAVCGVSTRNYAATIAEAGGGAADQAYNDIVGNLLENGRIVPAGIIAVNRAQERGYSLAYCG